MKKSLLLLMALIMTFTFSGCKKKTNIEPTIASIEETTVHTSTEESSTEAVETEIKETETEAMLEEYLDRPEFRELVCFVDGKEGKFSSSLYTGDFYSIYIMDEDWEHIKENLDGFSTDTWRNKKSKKDAVLKVIALKDKNMMEAQEYIKAAYPEYGLTEDKQGGLGGMNKAEQIMNAAFYNSDNLIYTVIISYPASESESNGIKLTAMADTFKN